MYRFWDLIIGPALAALRPSHVLEIGSEAGENTTKLLEFCRQQGAILHVIDPVPGYDVDAWQEEWGEVLDQHIALSLEVLPTIEQIDAVLIDGDHNWYTVFHELEMLDRLSREAGREFPLVFLHDVGWPYARRDMYYVPETIPEEFRHPYRAGAGLMPGHPGVVPGAGFNRDLFNARDEGGRRNGVLTAVEDFLAHTDLDLRWQRVTALNGLGALIDRRILAAHPKLAERLDAWYLPDLPNETAGATEAKATSLPSIHRELGRMEFESRHVKAAREYRRASNWVRSMAFWLDEITLIHLGVMDSAAWKVGDFLVQSLAKRVLRRPNVDVRWAPERLATVRDHYSAWRSAAGRPILDLQGGELPIGTESPIGTGGVWLEDEEEQWNEGIDRLTGLTRLAFTQQRLLAHWIEEVHAGLEWLQSSRRWQVGDLLVNRLAMIRHFRAAAGGLRRAVARESEIYDQFRARAENEANWRRTLLSDSPSLSGEGTDSAATSDTHALARGHGRSHAGRQMKLMTRTEKRRRASDLAVLPQQRLVSIIMPAWNREVVVAEAMASVQRQTYRNWELLVVDDGSEDGTASEVERLAGSDDRMRLISMEHRGVSAARNLGLKQAKGEIVAYLDSDNQWDPDYLLFMVPELSEPDAVCAYCALEGVDRDRWAGGFQRRRAFDLSALLRNNYIDLNVFVHLRSVLDRVDRFDESLSRWVDWDFILGIVKRHPPREVPVSLCTYQRNRKLNQITDTEPGQFKHKVINKHMIRWDEIDELIGARRKGHATIVIPVHGQSRLTRDCLDSIYSYAAKTPFDVVVVDNASEDDTGDVLAEMEALHQSLSRFEVFENYGFALGCNLGFSAALGEFVVFLNNDTTVTEGWLDELVKVLEQDSAVGVVGPKLLYPDGTLQCGGMVFSDCSAIPYHIYQGWDGEIPAINRSRDFQALTGACLAVRADDFCRLRGFDPLFLNGCEDIDYCFKARKRLGRRVVYNPSAVVYHYEGRTPGRSSKIMYNRRILVQRWGNDVEADDKSFYAADGVEVLGYEKPGSEPDGREALYRPLLQSETADGR